jgi:hypothetical protein
MGLWLLLSSVTALAQFLASIIEIFRSGVDPVGMIVAAIVVLLAFGALLLVLWLCFFRTDLIIDRLSLDKHFTQEQFTINMHRSTVLSIAVIVIGGIAVIDSLPYFIRDLYNYIQLRKMGDLFSDKATTDHLVIMTIQFVIGLFLLLKHRAVVNFIETKRRSKS